MNRPTLYERQSSKGAGRVEVAMRRTWLALPLVILMLTTSWASLASSGDADGGESTEYFVETLDSTQLWTAEEAALNWQQTSPSSSGQVPIRSGDGEIHTIMGSFDPTIAQPPLPPEPFTDSFDVENTRFIIVQLVEHDHGLIEELSERLGLFDLDHIPDDAYLVRLPADSNAAASALREMANHPGIRALVIQHPGWRLSPDLLAVSMDALEGKSTALVDVDVTPAGDLSPAQVDGLRKNLQLTGAEFVFCDAWLCQVRGIDASWMTVLANDGRILFTESHSPLTIENNYARSIVRVDQVLANHNGGLNGTGEVAAISDSGLDADHGDFTGRVRAIYNNFGPDNSAADTNTGHGTHVAATMLGDGSGDSSTQGIAPATTFHFYQLEHDQSGQLARYGSLYSMFQHSRQQSASVQSNSWGAQTSGGQYSSDSRSADSFMHVYGDYTVLFAVGNEGSQGSNTVAPPSTAKNVLTVGASTTGRPGTASQGQVASFSSRGETLDGRVKPDVVAPGVQICSARAEEAQYPAGPSCSSARHGNNDPKYMSADGSSTATPVAAGATVLVRQFMRSQMSLNNPRSDLIRAIIINGAKDLGSPDIPNEYEGWGQVDLERSIYPMNGILALNTFYDQDQSLSPGYSYLYTYSIDGAYGISATLVWNDREGSSSASQSSARLVNNLDLLVTAPDGTQYKGNMFQNGVSTTGGSHDSLNTVERVKIGSTQSGNWSILISNSGGSGQSFAIVITAMGNANPVSDLATVGASLWCSSVEPLESDTVLLGANWVNQAPAMTGSYRVTVEDFTTGVLLREETKPGLAGGSSDSFVFTYAFQTTGFHALRLTIDADDDVDEPNDFTKGLNNNIYDLVLNVTAIGVRVTPYLASGALPVGETELTQASIRTIDPMLDDEVKFRIEVANEGTADQSVDMRVTPVQFVRADGILDAPSDQWLKFLDVEPFYQLDSMGGVNNSVTVEITLRDESADLQATPFPTFALPGTYIVDVTAWYRSNPTVSHTVRLTIVVEEVAAMITIPAGTSGLSAVPGEIATFSLSVMNPGNSPTTYEMNCETPNRWVIELGNGNSSSLTLEPLARLQGIPVSVRIHVPQVSGGEPVAGFTENVTCVTSHSTDPTISATDSAVVTVNQLEAYSVDLYSSDGTPVGSSGNALDEAVSNDQDLNLTLSVKNLGNVPLTLSLKVTPERSDWPLGLFCGSMSDPRNLPLNLAAGDDIDCRIQVHVPVNVANGDSNEINVRTQLSMSNFIQNKTDLIVEERPDLTLMAPESGLMQVNLGSAGYSEFTYTNIGNVPLALEWEFGTVPEGWQVGFQTPPDLAIGMHRSDSLQISLVLPAGTAAGILSDTITLMVTGRTTDGVEVVRTASVGVEVGQSSWLFLSSDVDEFERLAKGDVRTGNLTVTNGGNVACKVDFDVDSAEGWSLTGLGTIQSLGAGESKTYEYSLENSGATSTSTLTILATPIAGEGVSLTNASVELRVSSASLSSDGGLLTLLDAAGVPGWAVGAVALLLLSILVVAVLRLRKMGGGVDAGEEIIGSGAGALGSVEQRREAALDTGVAADDMVSGSVSESEIAAALAASSLGPIGAGTSGPAPPGRAPPPSGSPPGMGSPPPPPGFTPSKED
jgi:uncharacterized membrane protein